MKKAGVYVLTMLLTGTISQAAHAKQILFNDEFESSSTSTTSVSDGGCVVTREEGSICFFSEPLRNMSIQTPRAVTYTADRVVVEFALKHIYEDVKSKFIVTAQGSSYELFTIPNEYEWAVCDVLFDFANNNALFYADGSLIEQKAIPFDRSTSISFKISAQLHGNGMALDYWTVYNLNTGAEISVADAAPTKINLRSDLPIAKDSINNIQIPDAQIKKIVQTSLNDISVYLSSPMVEENSYSISLEGITDIFGYPAGSSSLSVSTRPSFVVNSCEISRTDGGFSITGRIRNFLRTVESVDLLAALYDENGILIGTSSQTISVNPGTTSHTVSAVFEETPENARVKVFYWASYDELSLIGAFENNQ